ncbi:site-2 protease family protein [Alienimonas californiensis]|uniref:Peptidase family M50 n=1 Tax=Alienimonas californiensis TaxID=2527989 RepID=A0A517PD28_9PLAN|nr:site-2 protease family protein [Alienimonas californiensis]QDT17288.1 Peptidase family M50 [Alienimonas californiensis]
MFGLPTPTPLDLRFSLFGVPVWISAWHWLGAAFFGWQFVPEAFAQAGGGTFVSHLIVTILCIFLSILLHEMGHALMARAFGMQWSIVLLTFGGLAYGQRPPRIRWWQDVLVALAGPFIQLLLALALMVGLAAVPVFLDGGIDSALALTALNTLLFVNVAWPILNLLPIYPLDGGQVLRAVLGRTLRRGAELWTVRVGFFVAVMVGAFLYVRFHALFAAVLFGFLAMQNFQAMQASRGR